ncbi:hypothetical protein AKJ57_02260 [candidate division MSBL1 archaeon SCGC-AAA259A05]|uniref:Uncharacterized protein n=1 Tax=candidate division MSBL1 archaeon SCGC-AAA259A05 TaxID=1698259 RepID=A0A133UAB6_9EURY|nr:hypothetical protein AKJ57_02260 [candidate division MSBL1 archaeon SCGC-AAA259A05]
MGTDGERARRDAFAASPEPKRTHHEFTVSPLHLFPPWRKREAGEKGNVARGKGDGSRRRSRRKKRPRGSFSHRALHFRISEGRGAIPSQQKARAKAPAR